MLTSLEIDTIDRIHSAGLKVTAPRRAVLALFHRSPRRHLSADEVYRGVVTTPLHVSLTTIYRVLTELTKAELLRRHKFEPVPAVFEVNDGDVHDHLVCLTCGCVEEFQDVPLMQRQREIAQAKGFELKGHQFAIFGRCWRHDNSFKPNEPPIS